MTTRWLIGLASGSTADGVDAALVETTGVGLGVGAELLHALHEPYSPELREMIQRVAGASESCEIAQMGLLHRLLGETFAVVARQVADRASFSLQRVQCIGCPGHTVWHDPESKLPSTLALGMAPVVAERTGVTTVSDFRTRDVAAGGQGVPLAALVDYLLLRHPQENRLLVHLGGLARVVYLPANGKTADVLGFEAAPCNGLLDALMRQITGGRESYDPGGKNAVQGRCIDGLLKRWLAHPCLSRRPPRSLPRHTFGAAFAVEAVQDAKTLGASQYDLLCTATHFVAQGVATAVQDFLPSGRRLDRILVSGGGVRNGLLLSLLSHAFDGIPLERTDAHGVPADARKAMAFAILAALTLDGVPANLPSATGAVAPRLLGSVTPGSSANWARCAAWLAAQTAPLARMEEYV